MTGPKMYELENGFAWGGTKVVRFAVGKRGEIFLAIYTCRSPLPVMLRVDKRGRVVAQWRDKQVKL